MKCCNKTGFSGVSFWICVPPPTVHPSRFWTPPFSTWLWNEPTLKAAWIFSEESVSSKVNLWCFRGIYGKKIPWVFWRWQPVDGFIFGNGVVFILRGETPVESYWRVSSHVSAIKKYSYSRYPYPRWSLGGLPGQRFKPQQRSWISETEIIWELIILGNIYIPFLVHVTCVIAETPSHRAWCIELSGIMLFLQHGKRPTCEHVIFSASVHKSIR